MSDGLIKVILDRTCAVDMVEVFNEAFDGELHIERELILQNIFDDENFDPDGCFGIFLEGRLAGFIYGRYYKRPLGDAGLMPDNGWLSCLAVRKKYQRCGMGSLLVQWGEEFLLSHGRRIISLGGEYGRIFAGVPDLIPSAIGFFEKKGYFPGARYHDLINYGDIRIEGLNFNYNVEYKELDRQHIPELMRFLKTCFPGNWSCSLDRYIECHPDGIQDVFIALDGDKVIGFARIFDRNSVYIGPSVFWRRMISDDCGGLGPIGIDERYRGLNIGITLLVEALKDLRKRGCGPIVIDQTDLLDFYGKLGFYPWKGYIRASKTINAAL